MSINKYKKVFCSTIDDTVQQIFPIEKLDYYGDVYTEYTFPDTYLVQVDDDTEVTFGHKYNRETEEFEINPDYKENEQLFQESVTFEELVEENKHLKEEIAEIREMLKEVVDTLRA